MNNIFEAIPKDLKKEVFQCLAEGNGVTIERIISKGHRSPETGWYDQEKNEWVMILRGSAVLLFEDETTIKLNPGDFYDIAAHRKHKVSWTEPDIETVWLAVHY